MEGDRPETNPKHPILKTPNLKTPNGSKSHPPEKPQLRKPRLKRRGIGTVIGALEGTLEQLEVLGDIGAIAKPNDHL